MFKPGRPRLIFASVMFALAASLATFLVPSATNKAAASGGSGLSRADINRILSQAVSAAGITVSPLRSLPGNSRTTKMHVAVVARDGRFLDLRSMPDAWAGSVDIAIAKARTAAFFSSDENALTSRIIGDLSQPGGSLWGIGDSNQIGITGGGEFRNGIITFPGGVALYKNGHLVGGVGVSGDGVDQDESVAFAGAAGFLPGPSVAKLGYP